MGSFINIIPSELKQVVIFAACPYYTLSMPVALLLSADNLCKQSGTWPLTFKLSETIKETIKQARCRKLYYMYDSIICGLPSMRMSHRLSMFGSISGSETPETIRCDKTVHCRHSF